MLTAEIPGTSDGLKTLYIHIPFCKQICPFCSFAVRRDRPALHEPYLDGLLAELRLRLQTREKSISPLESIYIGGGTPSRLILEEVEWILNRIKEIWPWKKNAEITFEVNPEDLSPYYLTGLKTLGINRISLGGQSFQDAILQRLGRIHSCIQLRGAVRNLIKAGQGNWNLDLMFGIPDQSLEQFQADLDEALQYSPDHLSLYGLEIHQHTPYGHDPAVNAWSQHHAELFAGMYLHAVDRLEESGMKQYELSNFARSGHESRSNLLVWQGNPYLGIGVGAHSFDGKTRWGNVRSVRTYLNRINNNEFPVDFEERLTVRQQASEVLMLALRQPAGLDLDFWSSRFAVEQVDPYEPWLIRLHQEGKCVWNPPCLKLTPKGMLLADAITSRLMPGAAPD